VKEDIRVGVFICRCGTNISETVDTDELEKVAHSLPPVKFVYRGLYPCSREELMILKDAVKEHHLNRIVVVGCTPRLQEVRFKAICAETGLERSFLEIANIRENCAWVHRGEPDKATEKAKDILRMAVAKVLSARHHPIISSSITQKVLVIGGGVAGMAAAMALAYRGIQVILVEKGDRLGGVVNNLYSIYPHGQKPSEFLDNQRKEIKRHPNIKLFLKAKILQIQGKVGCRNIRLRIDGYIEDISVGAIIVATGSAELKPLTKWGYDGKRVLTALELEDVLTRDQINAKSVAFLMCGFMDQFGCSRICCLSSIKNAILIKGWHPDSEVRLIFREVLNQFHRDLKKAKSLGIELLRYTPEKPPMIKDREILVFDRLTGEEKAIPYDLLVIANPLIPDEDSKRLAELLKIKTDNHGFFIETQIKLRPGEYIQDGIFIAGAAHCPVNISEAIFQGYGTASRAAQFLAQGDIPGEHVTTTLDEDLCRRCGQCAKLCEFNAIEILKDEAGNPMVRLNPDICTGCGICAVSCPSGALSLLELNTPQIDDMLQAFLGEPSHPVNQHEI
jgi:heterodisulfide reductase subunit A